MEAPFRVLQQGHSFPARSGSSPDTADWLPDYLGLSWIAYASYSSLVIATAPVPTRKDEACLDLCQVVDMPSTLSDAQITCVRWAPSPTGILAASVGNLVCIYVPESTDPVGHSNFPDFPQGWMLSETLEHTFQVGSFGWTESGDGLISVGAEVVMWRHNGNGWDHLWISSVAKPQSLAAATFSAKGLAATADGTDVDDSKAISKGKATVWWWEDSLGLLETELVHPQAVVMIQWRPSKKPVIMQEPFRPVLMTSCKDGAVRLWLEIDSGKARMDKALGKDVPVKHLRPAYFVSAVIEVEQCIHGVLGKEVFVVWPDDSHLRDSSDLLVEKNGQVTNGILKQHSAGSCEWVVGLGPQGSICLWAVFCLDDMYPPRCPRVFFWKQSKDVLSVFQECVGCEVDQSLIKVVTQRLSKKSSDPPSYLDLFYSLQTSSFQWSRVWLPVSAIAGFGSQENLSSDLNGPSKLTTSNKKEAWGVVTEQLDATGHCCDIVCVTVHPITQTGLIATLDSQGYILLWNISSFPNVMHPNSSFFFPISKPSCRLTGSSDFEHMAWLPAILPIDHTVLVLANASCMEFYLVSKTPKVSTTSAKLISKVDILTSDGIGRNLKGIWTIPAQNECTSQPYKMSFSVIGLWHSELVSEVISHGLDVSMEEYTVDEPKLTVTLESSETLQQNEGISCLSIVPLSFLPVVRAELDCLVYEPLILARPYDFATGSVNGIVRLWKRKTGKHGVWLCVGLLRAYSGPVTALAIGYSGLKIATFGSIPLEKYGDGIFIWDIESYIEFAAFNLSSKVHFSGCPSSIEWLEGGNGHLMLGVLAASEIHVYVEPRISLKRTSDIVKKVDSNLWAHLASVQLTYGLTHFSWGPKGSIISTVKDHLVVFGPQIRRNKVIIDPLQATHVLHWKQAWTFLEAGETLSHPLPMYHPVALLYLLFTGNHQQARVCLSYLQQNIPMLYLNSQRKDLLRIRSTIHLTELFKMKEISDNLENATKLSWGVGFDEQLTYHESRLRKMSLMDEMTGSDDKFNAQSTSLCIENLESSLMNFSAALGLAEHEKAQLLTIADVLLRIETPKSSEYASLDPAGRRFWLSVQLLNCKQRRSGKTARVEDLVLDTKELAWALHSDCKDILLDMCLGDELTWPAMRALGVGFWFTDVTQLRIKIEKLARAQYLVSRDPKMCALLYLALQRKNVLMGLFKLSKDDKDKVLYEFFSRDFQDEKNQAAALKNAYVLMGKHRFELAAAFFLLGDDVSSAATVCAKNMGDLQLALVVCRLSEGANGITEHRLITDYALPDAQSREDIWLASLYQWLLGERLHAIEELLGRLQFSESIKENSSSMVMSERTGLVIIDPDVGQFCLLLTNKPSVQAVLSVAFITSLRRWLTLKTSTALEKLGLPIQALEHLSSILSGKEIVPHHHNLDPNSKYMQDILLASTEDSDFNIVLTGSEMLDAMKNRLALQYQSELVKAHPCWWSGSCCYPKKGSSGETPSTTTGQPYFQEVVDSNKGLLQSLNILDKHFGVDTKCIISELSRFTSDQNRLYLCSLFTRGNKDEDTLQSVPCFTSAMYVIQKMVKDFVLKTPYRWFLIYSALSDTSFGDDCSQDTSGLTVNSSDILRHASDLVLLLNLSLDNVEVKLDVIFIAMILFAIVGWEKGNSTLISLLSRMIRSDVSPALVIRYDMGALLRISNSGIDNSMLRTYFGSSTVVFVDSSKLVANELWHIVGLAFWDTFLSWAKKFIASRLNRNTQKNSIQNEIVLDDYLRALASMPTFFCKRLVCYLNFSHTGGKLHNLLWSASSNIECSDRRMNMVPQSKRDELSNVQLEESKENPVDDTVASIWRELVVISNIRSALELGGAQRVTTDAASACCLSKGFTYGSSDKLQEQVGAVILEEETQKRDGLSSLGASTSNYGFRNGEEILHSNGDLFEALSVNSCCPEQVVVASNRKGLVYLDINTRKSFSSTVNSLWGQVDWPQNGWAKSESTPLPTFVSPGVGLGSKEGHSLGLGGAAVGPSTLTTSAKESSFKGAGIGIPGYGGVGAFGLGWDDWEDFRVVDPVATVENMNTQAMNSHPLRPLFLVGSRNTHVYLWEYGKTSATATYGILPAANISPPYAVASISAVRFDHSGHRFATSAIDGTICTWQLEVGGKSNVRPTESCLCFDRHASDVAFVGTSGAILAATGASENNMNLVVWDNLAPAATSRASVLCHEGGARCLEMFDRDVGGGSISPIIVTCGKLGDISVHDFRFIATGKNKRQKYARKENVVMQGDQSSRKMQDGELNVNGMIWYIPKAHTGSITCISAVPGTSLFLTGGKDGDVKLWDANKCQLVDHWQRVHDKHMFLQHNARGFGAVVKAAVTDIRPIASGFLTCGGDGFVKLFRTEKYV